VASIQVIQGPDKGRTFELVDGENIVGRLDCNIELTDGTVSRRHAALTIRDGRWTLEDLGSANGTFLNGVRLSRSDDVQRGDQIRCGSTLLVFGGGGAPSHASVDMDEDGRLVDAAIVATVPSNEDSVIIPTPEAGMEAIGNLRILYDLISRASSIFNVDRLLQVTLDTVFDVLKADRGYVLLIDENDDLTVRATRQAEGASRKEVPISRTIIQEVIDKQVGLLSSNAMTDKRFASGKSVHDFGIRSAICVPIRGRDRVLGVIHVDCSVSDQTYSTEQLRLLTAIGYQTGLAIQNVRLHESAVQSERLAAVGETVAFVSHHIKNILQGLGAGADVVKGGLDREDMRKAKDAWPIVQRNLGRINELILNMLAFSKHREPLQQNVAVNHVVEECLELVGPQADTRSIALLSELDELPPIPADPDGLHQAFLNLLHNAMEAVDDESGIITVTSHFDAESDNVVVRVIDNGNGIEPDQVERIFTPFYSARGQRGTGLGLAVARKVIEEHGGGIEVDSTVGQGTTFRVLLPSHGRRDAGDTTGPAG